MAQKKDAGPTSTYKVLGNIHHDGEFYRRGPKSTIELTDKAAEPLLESKVVEPVTK